MYFLQRRRKELVAVRIQKTREVLEKRKIERLKKKLEYEEKKRIERERRRNDDFGGGGGMMRMLIFRSAIVDNSTNQIEKFNIPSESYELGLNKVKELIKFNTDDLVNIRHSKKEINGAFLPELVYKTDSNIQISKSELIRIIKLENKLRLSNASKSRNDYFFGCRLMSEIDQDFIEEALRFYGYSPSKDDSLKAYHLACGKHINDPEIKELVVWMKYDKMRKSTLTLNQEPIYNGIELYNLNNECFHLKELINENIPNLVICGSYSWPPFRSGGISTISKWISTLGDKVNIIPIYISEAHASNEWAASEDCSIKQHKNIEERIETVKIGMKKYGIDFPIYVDSFNETNFENTYNPWPERAYIFYKNQINYIAEPKIEGVFWHDEIEQWLRKNNLLA